MNRKKNIVKNKNKGDGNLRDEGSLYAKFCIHRPGHEVLLMVILFVGSGTNKSFMSLLGDSPVNIRL